mmetsp:Transcript_95/g.235  ORF Transcript_95/g.235 Transcript_95/m.235 type:complete len:377 (+) Transcript_95:82-1212(+)
MGFTTLQLANLSVCIFNSQVTAFGPRFPSNLTPTGNVVPSRLQTSKVSTAIKLTEENEPLDPSPSGKTKQQSAQLPFFLTQPLTQVVSDIDDTLKSSGGVTIAGVSLGGIDVQYARGDFYPGVFQFMFELSLYPVLVNQRYYEEYLFERGLDADVEGAAESPLVPPKVAVLTARAEEFKAALEIKEESKLAQAFRKTGESSKVYPTKGWGVGPVLYGSVSEWIIQYKKGLRKFNNFERLLEQDPTGQIMQYVYVGDTGELDQEAGETMLREYPEVVQAVFLHVVSSDQPSSFPPSGLPIPSPKLINGRPLVFFRTYVGAAAKATQLGLMEGDGLMRVVDEAEKALLARGVPKTSDKWIDLERDVEEAYKTLGMVLS